MKKFFVLTLLLLVAVSAFALTPVSAGEDVRCSTTNVNIELVKDYLYQEWSKTTTVVTYKWLGWYVIGQQVFVDYEYTASTGEIVLGSASFTLSNTCTPNFGPAGWNCVPSIPIYNDEYDLLWAGTIGGKYMTFDDWAFWMGYVLVDADEYTLTMWRLDYEIWLHQHYVTTGLICTPPPPKATAKEVFLRIATNPDLFGIPLQIYFVDAYGTRNNVYPSMSAIGPYGDISNIVPLQAYAGNALYPKYVIQVPGGTQVINPAGIYEAWAGGQLIERSIVIPTHALETPRVCIDISVGDFVNLDWRPQTPVNSACWPVQ